MDYCCIDYEGLICQGDHGDIIFKEYGVVGYLRLCVLVHNIVYQHHATSENNHSYLSSEGIQSSHLVLEINRVIFSASDSIVDLSINLAFFLYLQCRFVVLLDGKGADDGLHTKLCSYLNYWENSFMLLFMSCRRRIYPWLWVRSL